MSTTYVIFDRKTMERATRGVYKTRAAANRAVDKLDNTYGGYRHFVREMPAACLCLGLPASA